MTPAHGSPTGAKVRRSTQSLPALAAGALALIVASDAAGEDEPSCEDRCRDRAISYYRLCVEDGGDDAECMAKAEAVYGACVEDCNKSDDDADDDGATSGEDDDETACVTQCRLKAKRAFDKCRTSGEDEGVCVARARRVFAGCKRACP